MSRQEEWEREETRRKAEAPDPSCPPGMKLMPEDERLETLKQLQVLRLFEIVSRCPGFAFFSVRTMHGLRKPREPRVYLPLSAKPSGCAGGSHRACVGRFRSIGLFMVFSTEAPADTEM